MAINSLVAGGCIISGAVVRESLLYSMVRIDERSTVERSVVMPGVRIGKGCVVRNAIIDEHCEIPDGMQIGVDAALDTQRFDVSPRGIVLVTPETLAAVMRPG
jgi:glucose-1-phosphate adenylyltransferase